MARPAKTGEANKYEAEKQNATEMNPWRFA